jgi:putative nucleotidyltransferase with HDIG domain
VETPHEEDYRELRAQTLSRLSRLPAFSHAALKLLTISSDAESAFEDFEAAFRGDPALATDLLIVANSMEFGFMGVVTNIPQALALLGLDRSRSLACRIAMKSYLPGAANSDVNTSWRHSIASAALAEHLAKMSSLSLPMMYTAALLHDIGRLGMQLTLREKYRSVITLDTGDIGKNLTIEKTIFGMNHCEAGDALSRTWGFPESLGRHIHMHHGHVTMEEDPTAYIVQTACRLAEGLGYPEYATAPAASQSSLEQAIPSRFRNHPAFTPRRLAAVVESTLAAVNAT